VARISAPEHDEKFRINETIVFDGSESTDDKELLDTSFKWDFGDGNSTLAMITSHRYAREGTYTVKLTVTDVDGESDNTSISIRVLGNHDPILDWWDVVPDTGHTLVDPFNFSVRYTDPDNDPPEYVTLLLADEPEYTPVIMEPVDPNDEDCTDGKMYFHIVKPLASRPYPAVTFAASDGIASAELVVKGPVVLQDRAFPNSVGDILVMAVYVGPNNLEYIPVSSPPSTFPPGLFPIGVYIELLLETTFLKAADISINYTFHDVEDIDVDTLAIYRWSVSGEDAGWEYLEDSEVDTSTGIVSAPIPSLQNDIYTVLGNKLNPPPNHKPVAVITVDGKTYSPGAVVERTYKPGDVIEFDGSKSYDPDEDDLNDYIASYVWSFNDGSAPAEGKLAMHSYDIQDRYEVVLTVRDSFNEEGSVFVIIIVKADEGNSLLYLIVIVCIVVILILLFYHKGEGTRPASPKTEHKEPSQDLEETNGADGEDVEEEDTTELDDIIDELEEDRSR
jgi:PKD repeat protein